MLSNFPTSKKTEGKVFLWDQLTLGVNDRQSYPEIIVDFWKAVVPGLNELRNVNIKAPEDEAWFHLRKTTCPNQDQSTLSYAQARIEIFRLKRGFISQEAQEKIRLYTSRYSDVVCAGWWPTNFTGRHDNAFLSFIQKLSVLLVRNKIFYNKYLGQISNEYEKCPFCQEAYNVMMAPNSPWSEALKPWFEYMSSTNMEPNRTHEYAHWFGHILTGWS